MGRDEKRDELEANQEAIFKLAETMDELYKSMDESLKFKVEKEAKTATQAVSKLEKDYRGVACPMNFVKTKLVLETMSSGQQLEILLDDGEPIQNVPNSVKLEGHKVLEQTHTGPHWTVVIEKK